MLIRNLLTGVAALCLGLTLPSAASAAPPPDADLGVSLGGGTTAWIQQQAQQAGAKKSCLSAVTKWRKDALDTNVRAPGGNGATVKQMLSKRGISVDQYLNPKWSNDLEAVAIARAVEMQSHGIMGHARPNGEGPMSVKSKRGITGQLEVISYGMNSCAAAVDHFATEKSDWVKRTGGVTGHYTALIDPGVTHYGFGGSIDQVAKSGSAWYMSKVWVGHGLGTQKTMDESATELSGPHMFPVNLADASVNLGAKMSTDSVPVNGTVTPRAKTIALNERFELRGTWTVADTSLAEITSDGKLRGKVEGSTFITLELKTGKSFKFPLKVTPEGTPVPDESENPPVPPENPGEPGDPDNPGDPGDPGEPGDPEDPCPGVPENPWDPWLPWPEDPCEPCPGDPCPGDPEDPCPGDPCPGDPEDPCPGDPCPGVPCPGEPGEPEDPCPGEPENPCPGEPGDPEDPPCPELPPEELPPLPEPPVEEPPVEEPPVEEPPVEEPPVEEPPVEEPPVEEPPVEEPPVEEPPVEEPPVEEPPVEEPPVEEPPVEEPPVEEPPVEEPPVEEPPVEEPPVEEPPVEEPPVEEPPVEEPPAEEPPAEEPPAEEPPAGNPPKTTPELPRTGVGASSFALLALATTGVGAALVRRRK